MTPPRAASEGALLDTRVADRPCFLETQLPVAKLSKESYSERTAKQSQTLTGLGKWWGRKPLVLCRATLLGLLLPTTDDPKADLDLFLRLMTMDRDGLLRRKTASIPLKVLYDFLSADERDHYFTTTAARPKLHFRKGITKEEKSELQTRVFLALPYDQRLTYCDRPEEVDGPSAESWAVINAHLRTTASSLVELVRELGRRRFGHAPRVADAFSGGGSIPFEAARLGCESFGSDLSPVAALLSWASTHVIGGSPDVSKELHAARRAVFEAVDRQIQEWGVESREPDLETGRSWRADAYLYCIEATCPECGWRVPLAPSWVIGKGTKTIARLVADPAGRRFDFDVRSDVSEAELAAAELAGTVRDGDLVCPNPTCRGENGKERRTPIKSIRGDGRGTFGDNQSLLRPWEAGDVVPRLDDIFGERLYCIRWKDSWSEQVNGETREVYERHYEAPTAQDLDREQRVLQLLTQRLEDWQRHGYLPSRRIEPGAKTDEPIRTRGWMHWQHLFTPRQLLVNGLLAETAARHPGSRETAVGLLLAVGRCADWNSRLSRWHPGVGNEKSEQTFSNQALNTLANFGVRPLQALETTWFAKLESNELAGKATISACDARRLKHTADIWITDPPYADAVQYEELSELVLSWYQGRIPALFPDWYADSKRALAVRGRDEAFRSAMVQCYRHLAEHTSPNGLQVVMFTHQDAGVWADLALIVWAAGLRVTAAWCIATETESAQKEGNYVQGTVLLVLRRQIATEPVFLDEVYPEIEAEVRRQLDSMRALDDVGDPSFGDTDYQLAAYAAALRVLTSHRIVEIDASKELGRTRAKGETSPVEGAIEAAVKIACDHLVPRGVSTHLWKSLLPSERFYLKGLEVETHGESRTGVYQELARGFGLDEYTPLMWSTKANEARLKTATELGRREMTDDAFGTSAVRSALFAVFKTAETDSPRDGLTWLSTEVHDYASNRPRILEILDFLGRLTLVGSVAHWRRDAEAAILLRGALLARHDPV